MGGSTVFYRNTERETGIHVRWDASHCKVKTFAMNMLELLGSQTVHLNTTSVSKCKYNFLKSHKIGKVVHCFLTVAFNV